MTRLMGGLFAVGSAGFVIGPLAGYVGRVGAHADALTFFIASILFTGGGLAQCRLARPERRSHRAGRLAWRGAWIQSVGTVLFNLMTLEAISDSASGAGYAVLVWIPNAVGSVCFLASGVLLYLSAPRAGWRPVRRAPGWWEPPINLLGCVLFAVSAVTAYAVSSSGQLLDAGISNWTTTLGAACFLAVGLAPLITGLSFKVPRLSRLIAFEHALQREAAEAEHELEADVSVEVRAAQRSVEAAGRAIEPEVDRLEIDYEAELTHVERLVERELPRRPEAQ